MKKNINFSKPRNICVVVDNPSWIIPYAEQLVQIANSEGDNAVLVRDYRDITFDGICFLLGCIKIMPKEILDRNYKTLVIHESELPLGRGFSPLFWQILEGKNKIPICLIEANIEPDKGDIIFKNYINFEGHELNDELRNQQGLKSIELCMKFLRSVYEPNTSPQRGKSSYYKRRVSSHSKLDPGKTIKEQFNLFRIVDNERYPAFFDIEGHRYKIKIEKIKDE